MHGDAVYANAMYGDVVSGGVVYGDVVCLQRRSFLALAALCLIPTLIPTFTLYLSLTFAGGED